MRSFVAAALPPHALGIHVGRNRRGCILRNTPVQKYITAPILCDIYCREGPDHDGVVGGG